MVDVAQFGYKTPLRCFGPPANRHGVKCAEPAVWQRGAAASVAHAFYCDRHKLPSDTPIAADAIYRRVHITAEIVFAGVDLTVSGAEAEALAQLTRAVQQVGGIVSLDAVRSITGRHGLQRGPGDEHGPKGRGR